MALVIVATVPHSAVDSAGEDVMTNQWHVHLVDDLGKDAAVNVAKRHGFSFVSPVSPPRTVCKHDFRVSVNFLGVHAAVISVFNSS